MVYLTANELKRGGVTALEKAMHSGNEHQVTIDVRGKPKYIVLDIAEYNAYREYELDKAIKEAETDYTNGNYDIINNFDSLANELRNTSNQ
ncbi:MAG: prevent-host-death protein [Alteromonadaceae bacterium]|nr:prevent-host-death protein [Alteromonadaceae bacterium]